MTKLLTALDDRKNIDETLTVKLGDIATATTAAKPVDRVFAKQYTRQLNAQNQKFFNQLFRPGLITENCRTYALVKDEFTALPPCTGTWLRDKFRRGSDNGSLLPVKPEVQSFAAATIR